MSVSRRLKCLVGLTHGIITTPGFCMGTIGRELCEHPAFVSECWKDLFEAGLVKKHGQPPVRAGDPHGLRPSGTLNSMFRVAQEKAHKAKRRFSLTLALETIISTECTRVGLALD